jgi:phosphopantetheine adenylyltransferase
LISVKRLGAQFILRGLRNPADFEFEKAIAQANRMMDHELETVFLLTDPEFAAISRVLFAMYTAMEATLLFLCLYQSADIGVGIG